MSCPLRLLTPPVVQDGQKDVVMSSDSPPVVAERKKGRRALPMDEVSLAPNELLCPVGAPQEAPASDDA